MRLVILIALLTLSGCSSPETEGRKLLTEAQRLQMQFKTVEALDLFETVGEKFPQTTAATDALRLAKPLSDQREIALVACASYFLDTGADPRSEDDLVRDRGVANWKGPYARAGQMGAFAKWAVDRKCAR